MIENESGKTRISLRLIGSHRYMINIQNIKIAIPFRVYIAKQLLLANTFLVKASNVRITTIKFLGI